MPPPLHLVICGSVDDGKSTLIGRLLHECGAVFEDQLAAVERASQRYGTQGDDADLALLLDGLQAEREQGITIDVAYRRFETPRRAFFVADVPSHEQYTRNMATGASLADLAVMLVDARQGVLPQTARHTRIAAMFGVRRVVLAVNKMDLVGWEAARFDAVAGAFAELVAETGIRETRAIPLSALAGDNLTRHGGRSPWYAGPTLLEALESAEAEPAPETEPFRMPVQYVNRPNSGFRGYCGRVASGAVAPGDRVRVAPSGAESEVEEIVVWQGARERAERGDSVTLRLKHDLDIGRGDVVAAADHPVEAADQFQSEVLWMGDDPLVVGRSYRLKLHTSEVGAAATRIRHRLDVTDGRTRPAATLGLNEIGSVNLATDRPLPFAPYEENRRLGGFVLLDRRTDATVAAGMIRFPLRRAANLRWQDFAVTRELRARAKLQRPRCLWLTGLPGSGKSTIANLLEKRLAAEGRHTYVLDGDNVRHGLNRDLGFTEPDRAENVRRVAEVARLMVDAGLIVIVAFISPFRAEREQARDLFEPGDFREIFVDAPLAVCEARDPKGLYARARRGEVTNFTGISSPYEPPERPDVRLNTGAESPAECVEQVLASLE
ncbi:MAG: adenylyl-sulfate kinase [Acidobacteria bacterium]|nr:adenylyl-sulfate kinase [Acidobacteriota bacterium]